jgi:hypothetical protein
MTKPDRPTAPPAEPNQGAGEPRDVPATPAGKTRPRKARGAGEGEPRREGGSREAYPPDSEWAGRDLAEREGRAPS